MEIADTGTPKIGQKVILTRARRQNINENLNRLEQASMKKKIAQELYYNNKPLGQSPMFKESADKGSVYERLGENKVMDIAKQNKVVILNRSRFRWKPCPEGILTRKYRNLAFNQRPRNRIQAQKRLENFKQNTRNNYPFVRKRPFQLRRHNYLITNPENMQFQIKNFNHTPLQHSVQNSLDHAIQMNIRLVQRKVNTLHAIPNVAITSRDFGYTKINLNDRFSSLP